MGLDATTGKAAADTALSTRFARGLNWVWEEPSCVLGLFRVRQDLAGALAIPDSQILPARSPKSRLDSLVLRSSPATPGGTASAGLR